MIRKRLFWLIVGALLGMLASIALFDKITSPTLSDIIRSSVPKAVTPHLKSR